MVGEDSTYDMEDRFVNDYGAYTVYYLDETQCESLIHAYGIMKAIQKWEDEQFDLADTAHKLFDCIAFNEVWRHVKDIKKKREQEEQQEGQQEGEQEGEPRA